MGLMSDLVIEITEDIAKRTGRNYESVLEDVTVEEYGGLFVCPFSLEAARKDPAAPGPGSYKDGSRPADFSRFFSRKKAIFQEIFPSILLAGVRWFSPPVFAGCSRWCSLWIFATSVRAVFALCALFAFRWIFPLSADIKFLLDVILPIYGILFSVPCKYAIVRSNIPILALVISEIDYIHENDLLEGLKKSV